MLEKEKNLSELEQIANVMFEQIYNKIADIECGLEDKLAFLLSTFNLLNANLFQCLKHILNDNEAYEKTIKYYKQNIDEFSQKIKNSTTNNHIQ